MDGSTDELGGDVEVLGCSEDEGVGELTEVDEVDRLARISDDSWSGWQPVHSASSKPQRISKPGAVVDVAENIERNVCCMLDRHVNRSLDKLVVSGNYFWMP